MHTFTSHALTARHAAADALLLASHASQPVLLTWHGAEVYVDSRYTAADVAAVLPKED